MPKIADVVPLEIIKEKRLTVLVDMNMMAITLDMLKMDHVIVQPVIQKEH